MRYDELNNKRSLWKVMQNSEVIGSSSPFNNIQSFPTTGSPQLEGQPPTFQAFFNTITRQMPAIPPYLHRAIAWFREAHTYYSLYKLSFTVQQDIVNGGTLGTLPQQGALITMLARVSTEVDYALSVAIVTKCVVDILNKYRALNASLNDLRDAICYKIEFQNRQQLDDDVQALAASTLSRNSLEISSLFVQILKITHCALIVLWRTFELSMILQDAYLYFNNDPQTRFVACTDLVANWRSYSNMVHDELERILEDNRPVAQQLLIEFGKERPNRLVQQLIRQLKQGVRTVQGFLDQPHSPSSSSSHRYSFFSMPFASDGRFQLPNCRNGELPGGRFSVQSIRV